MYVCHCTIEVQLPRTSQTLRSLAAAPSLVAKVRFDCSSGTKCHNGSFGAQRVELLNQLAVERWVSRRNLRPLVVLAGQLVLFLCYLSKSQKCKVLYAHVVFHVTHWYLS